MLINNSFKTYLEAKNSIASNVSEKYSGDVYQFTFPSLLALCSTQFWEPDEGKHQRLLPANGVSQ